MSLPTRPPVTKPRRRRSMPSSATERGFRASIRARTRAERSVMPRTVAGAGGLERLPGGATVVIGSPFIDSRLSSAAATVRAWRSTAAQGLARTRSGCSRRGTTALDVVAERRNAMPLPQRGRAPPERTCQRRPAVGGVPVASVPSSRRGGCVAGKSVDDLEGEVRAIHDDLARDLDVLASHLPSADSIGRLLGMVAAIAVATWVLLSWLLSARRRARDRRNIRRAVREVLDEG